ncbi:MAG: ribosome assembly RNA-binding protein YhbY [Byssovorax sp.]
MPLTGKQKRYLRSLGHHLDPVVQIGKQGLTPPVIAAVDTVLEQHELVKLRVGTECPDDRYELFERLAPEVGAELAQIMGRTALLYRRRKKDPSIVLPKGDAPAAAAKARPAAEPDDAGEDDVDDVDAGDEDLDGDEG